MSGARIRERIEAAGKEGRLALIPFVTAGYPRPDVFWDIMDELDAAGADVIEIGVPFSDPVADGPIVEAASQKALENGVTLPGIINDLKQRAGRYKAAILLMGYYNPILRYGLGRFAADSAEAGVSGCIVPDLPLEESAPLRAALAAVKGRDEEGGPDLIPLVGLNTSDERMRAYAKHARSFVYLVSVLGTTGTRDGFDKTLGDALARAQTIFPVPLALGFGLSRPEQVADLPVKPHGVVFGSALLKHIAEGKSVTEFLSRWK